MPQACNRQFVWC